MSKMVEEIPSAAIHILDQCITRETDLRNRSYSKMVVERKITYDFYPFQKKSSRCYIYIYNYNFDLTIFEYTFYSVADLLK